MAKTNAYRLGVNQLVVGPATTTNGTDPTGITGALAPYCSNMVAVAPPFLKGFQTVFTGQGTPAANVGNNLFTFLCERYLMSLTQLGCPAAPFQPVVCQLDGNGAATACTITLQNGTTTAANTTLTGTTGTNGTATGTGMTGGTTGGVTGGTVGTGLTGTNNGVVPVVSPVSSSPCTFTAPVATPSPTAKWGGRQRYGHRKS